MLSRTLSFNRGFIVQLIRQVGWVSVMYSILLFIALPLQLMMAASRPSEHYAYRQYFVNATSFFDVVVAMQILFIFIVPTLMAIFIFRYLHSKLAADFIHSLPISRASLFAQVSITGALLLLLPLVINSLVLMVLGVFMDASNLFNITNFAYWLAVSSLFNMFMFFVAVLIGMLVGMSVLQGALVVITVFFPAGITVLFIANLDYFLYGISINHYISDNLIRLIPFVRLGELRHNPFIASEFFVYFALTVIACALAIYIYRKRKVEAASQAIAFRPLRPVFLYGVTFCSMLLGGLYFGAIQEGDLTWVIFGYGFFSIIGYIIAQMILNKSWQVHEYWRGYLAFIVAIAIIGTIIQLDVAGFEKRVPNAEQVVEVAFYGPHSTFPYYNYGGKLNGSHVDDEGKVFGAVNHTYKDPENIENIIKLHNQLVADKQALSSMNRNNSYYLSRTQINVAYTLTNGRTLVRQYMIPANNYLEQLSLIMESEEYKKNLYPMLRVHDLSSLETITFRSYHTSKTLILTERILLQELHEILQQEVLNETYDDMVTMSREPWGHIEYSFNDRNIYLTVAYKKSYQALDAWLASKGLAEQARYSAHDVSHAYLIEDSSHADSSNINKRGIQDVLHNVTLADIEKYAISEDWTYNEITDKAVLEQLLMISNWDDTAPLNYYLVLYFQENTFPTYMMINAKKIPAELKF